MRSPYTQSARWWPERLAPVLAFTGLLTAFLTGFNVTQWPISGSDFKTLYASAYLFAHNAHAYRFSALAAVFTQNHVVLPPTWYAHAPTYPPFTLAVLAPITLLPMVQAVYFWIVLSTLALIIATWALADSAERTFALPRPWRLALVALVAAFPLVNFGLQVDNVSVFVSALCIIALLPFPNLSLNARALLFTLAFLLKPHLPFWFIVAMFVARNREDRALARRTCLFFAAALACFLLWLGLARHFDMQLADYTAVVRSEVLTGSLAPANHELLDLWAQVTSLQSLLAYGLPALTAKLFNLFLLLIAGTALAYFTRTARDFSGSLRLPLFASWTSFGLLTTYHRSHDAIVLLLLLPWLLDCLRRRLADPIPWLIILCATAIGTGPSLVTYASLATSPHLHGMATFLLFRQAALATFLLFLVLLWSLLRHRNLPATATVSSLPA